MKLQNKYHNSTTRNLEEKEIEVEVYLWQYATKTVLLTLYVVVFYCEEFTISVMEHIMMMRPAQLE